MSTESAQVNETEQPNYKLPTGTTLQHCAKLSIVEDKPNMFDYWTPSCDKEVFVVNVLTIISSTVA